MSASAFKDHFSESAGSYALNRPTYPLLLDDFSKQLAEIWPDGETITIRWPVTIRAARIG